MIIIELTYLFRLGGDKNKKIVAKQVLNQP